MKEINLHMNHKLYYTSIFIIITLMIMGLLVDNPLLSKVNLGYIVHCGLVFILSVCILLYPKKETHVFRLIIITVASAYFYTMFFLYPDNGSGIVFLCFIPAISILFFDTKLFYFSLLLNSISIIFTFSYIIFFEQGIVYTHIQNDILGNAFNFIGSQVIIYLIFYFSSVRIQKQRTYYEQLQQSERLKLTGQLAAAVAHEIRNPLTVVKGFLQLYEKSSHLNSDVKNHFTLMIDEINTAEHVISQFLTVAKPDRKNKTETLDVKVALQSVTDLLNSYGSLHDNWIELHVEGNCNISVNIIEFKQLIINIIKNAIEVSNEGDSVRVEAKSEKGFVVIKVIDRGCGMTEAEVQSLGTPFYSLKNKGTGLGLMICYNIAQKYNGTIEFDSTKGKGTTVIIKFPAVY
jgi:two-component system, sporulation sensor kinase B